MHYHDERNHHGLDNELLTKATMPTEDDCDERMSGLHSCYHRAA